ncbi:MAG: inositol monophosphatase [Alphaproteobacteria bacterium]|nr:inositol monophosphatase [Alphaproteobacteria bacterium]
MDKIIKNLRMDDVEAAIRETAQTIIQPHFRNLRAHEIHFKGEDDPVTVVDEDVEVVLQQRLLDILPSARVVGEEAFSEDPSILSVFEDDDPVWIIDPLDGTKAFIAGEPVYGVIVALAHKKETLAGWLYDPSSDEFVTAQKGAGAFYKGTKLKVLPPAPLSAMTGVVSSYILESYKRCTAVHVNDKPRFYRMLSACHDYARLVVGIPHFSRQTPQVHFYCWLRNCTPWDSAAGILINTEAGGYTAHWDGEPFKPCDYGHGVLTAPDRDSWQELCDWISSFCHDAAAA